MLHVSRTEIHPIEWQAGGVGFPHLLPAMILRYFSALCAALALAASKLGAKPWHTVIGCVDSSTRHWHRPLRLRSSAATTGDTVKRARQEKAVQNVATPTHPGPGN